MDPYNSFGDVFGYNDKNKHSNLTIFSLQVYASCTNKPRLLKQMVMRPLCDTNMMNNIYCVQIDP